MSSFLIGLILERREGAVGCLLEQFHFEIALAAA